MVRPKPWPAADVSRSLLEPIHLTMQALEITNGPSSSISRPTKPNARAPTPQTGPCRVDTSIIAVCSAARLAPKCFIRKCHMTSTFQATYLVRFPVVLTDALDIQEDMQPPLMRSGKGRRQQKRYRPGDRPSEASQARRPAPPSRSQSQASQVLAGEARRLRKCGQCGRMAAHNARTCQEPPETLAEAESDLY